MTHRDWALQRVVTRQQRLSTSEVRYAWVVLGRGAATQDPLLHRKALSAPVAVAQRRVSGCVANGRSRYRRLIYTPPAGVAGGQLPPDGGGGAQASSQSPSIPAAPGSPACLHPYPPPPARRPAALPPTGPADGRPPRAPPLWRAARVAAALPAFGASPPGGP